VNQLRFVGGVGGVGVKNRYLLGARLRGRYPTTKAGWQSMGPTYFCDLSVRDTNIKSVWPSDAVTMWKWGGGWGGEAQRGGGAKIREIQLVIREYPNCEISMAGLG
jgi:hypothetical protein